MFNAKLLIAPLLTVALAACGTLPDDRGERDVKALLETRLPGPMPSIGRAGEDTEAHVAALLDNGLNRAEAVRIALMNNPKLRLAYAQLGLASADLFEAGRLSNPSLSLAVMDSNVAGAMARLTAGITQRVGELIFLKTRKRLAGIELERTKLLIAAQLFELTQAVSAACHRYAAALQLVQLQRLNTQATTLAAGLAQRYYDAGNINRLELSVAEAAQAEAELKLQNESVTATAARLRLERLLGLTPSNDWILNDALRAPGANEDALAQLQSLAQQHRLELQAAATRVSFSTDKLALTRRSRLLGNVQAGLEVERESDDERLLGPNLNLELPLFNQGQGRVLRDTAALERDRAKFDELKLAIENAVALAHAQLLAARARVTIYRTRFIPARRQVVARTQELQNYQIVSPFESLRVKRAEFDAYAEYITAVRDYWLARVALSREIGVELPSKELATGAALDVRELTESKHHASHRHSPSAHTPAPGQSNSQSGEQP